MPVQFFFPTFKVSLIHVSETAQFGKCQKLFGLENVWNCSDVRAKTWPVLYPVCTRYLTVSSPIVIPGSLSWGGLGPNSLGWDRVRVPVRHNSSFFFLTLREARTVREFQQFNLKIRMVQIKFLIRTITWSKCMLRRNPLCPIYWPNAILQNAQGDKK